MTFAHFVNQANVMIYVQLQLDHQLIYYQANLNNQQLALESITKLVIGQPLNILYVIRL